MSKIGLVHAILIPMFCIGCGDGDSSTGMAAAGGAGNAGAAGSGSHPSLQCPSGKGPAMVAVPTPDGKGACIDQSEVTRSQYSAFLADFNAGVKVTEDEVCDLSASGFETKHDPLSSCLEEPGVCQQNCDNHPQVCVTWCDAFAFCQWAGKRLCGGIDGTRIDLDDEVQSLSVNTSGSNEWVNACASGGNPKLPSESYPYGGDYAPASCNGYENQATGCVDGGECTTREVMSMPSCQPRFAFDGVFDLSGNVAEYLDACGNSPVTDCLAAGGSFAKPAQVQGGPDSWVKCGYLVSVARDAEWSSSIGFRCCADGQ